MALVQFGELRFDGDLVAFDKDGTLIDFEFMWGCQATAWVERLAAEAGDGELRRELYRTLGYDPVQQRTIPQSPLASAGTRQLQAIAAAVLYGHGIPWTESEDRARQAFAASTDPPLADLIRSTGDVAGLLERLQAAGVRVAVLTTDHRAKTKETLRIMGVAHLVDDTICGDDRLPVKPAPDMLQATCKNLRIEAARAAIVGDTVADLLMGRRAGAGLVVGVLSGVGEPALLREHADVVMRSIDEIRVGLPG